MLGFVTEVTGHAAAARVDEIHTESGNELQHLSRGCECVECFLVAMAVQQRALLRQRGEREPQLARPVLPRQEFLDQQRALTKPLRAVAETHYQKLVAQRKKARWLEANDPRAALDVRR